MLAGQRLSFWTRALWVALASAAEDCWKDWFFLDIRVMSPLVVRGLQSASSGATTAFAPLTSSQ